MATLLKQGKQVGNSKIYEDIDLGTQNVNREYNATSDEVVETLEQDLNIIRSILKDIHGEEKWTDLPNITLQELNLVVQEHSNHEQLFHHDRNEVIKLIFSNGTLTDIKTYNNEAGDILLAHSAFIFAGETLSIIEKITYNIDGIDIYQHLKKTFIYDMQDNLERIINEKIV